jgi:hypothetical protein
MTIDLTPVHFNATDSKLVRAVQRHPRLAALLPAGIEPLVTAYITAKATAAAVGKLTVDAPDFAAALDADLKAGRQPDAAKLVKTYATAQREAAEIRAVVEQLSALPARYQADVVREVQAAAATMYVDLADQIDEVIDRGAELLPQLDGTSSADEALDRDRGDAWKALKALTAEYAEIREASLALARAEDPSGFPPGSFNVALALFAGITRAIPNVQDLIENGTEGRLVGFKRAPLAWPVTEYTSPLHLLAVLRQRNILQPHVVSAAEVSALRAELHEAPQDGVQREPGRLAQGYGGEEEALRNSYIAQRIRTQPPRSDGFVLEGTSRSHR